MQCRVVNQRVDMMLSRRKIATGVSWPAHNGKGRSGISFKLRDRVASIQHQIVHALLIAVGSQYNWLARADESQDDHRLLDT